MNTKKDDSDILHKALAKRIGDLEKQVRGLKQQLARERKLKRMCTGNGRNEMLAVLACVMQQLDRSVVGISTFELQRMLDSDQQIEVGENKDQRVTWVKLLKGSGE
jgi:hypothetical protein